MARRCYGSCILCAGPIKADKVGISCLGWGDLPEILVTDVVLEGRNAGTVFKRQRELVLYTW